MHMAVELAGAVGECLVHPELFCAWWAGAVIPRDEQGVLGTCWLLGT